MKPPAIQNDIVAFLRAAGAPRSSRDLASRFLKIETGDEETCRKLLAPFLGGVPGVAHRPGEGWTWLRPAPGERPVAATDAPGTAGAQSVPGAPEAGEAPEALDDAGTATLIDFVALAVDGVGPGGSGGARAASVLPVLAGEPCQEEHFPAAALEDGSEEIAGPGVAGHPAGLTADDLAALAETIGDLPIVCHRVGREIEPLRRMCAAAGTPLQTPVISAAKLGHLLLGLKANHATVDLAAALGVTSRGPDDCRGRARLVAEAYLLLVPRLRARGITTLDALLEYQDMPAPPLDLGGYAFTAADLQELPTSPGVYRFLDRDGAVIYVGKAKNLRVRVGSYFVPSARGTAKGRAVLAQVHAFAITPVASELEALLLEAALIEEHRPRLNRQFEVHERPAPYGPRLNLAVVLPDVTDPGGPPATGTVHLLRGGRYLGRHPGLPIGAGAIAGEDRWRDALERLTALYFGARSGDRAGRAGGGGAEGGAAGQEVDWPLVASYLGRHRDEVSWLDVDECASAEEAGRRLLTLARALGSGAGRVLAR